MKRGKLIAFVGYKGAGKTTVLNMAIYDPRVAMRALPFMRLGFADPFNDMLSAMGVPEEILANKKRWDEPVAILQGKSVRHATTTLGTEWGRQYLGEKVWTDIAIQRADNIQRQGINVVIDNCRHDEEFETLSNDGAIMVAFHRPGLVPDLSHASEQRIAALQELCDIPFVNEGRFEQSVNRLRALLHDLSRDAT